MRLVRLLGRGIAATMLCGGVMAAVAPTPAGAAGAVKLTGFGADTCTAPSESQMRAFWTNTPYSYWGIYIGGSDRGCSQPNLTSTWVSHMLTMGWDLLPIWVGRQNPCTAGQATYFSRNILTAYQQGRSEALAAYNAWRGLSSYTHVPIDLDLESPSVDTASCRAATRSFVNGWVTQLHIAPAQIAGVYTSVCGGYIDDFAHLPHVPDFIDGADWDGVRSVGSMSCVPSNHWIYNQRHKQYKGGHDVTYNHVTLNIDSRCADAAVYGVRSSLSTTHYCARTYSASRVSTAASAVEAAAQRPVSWHGSVWRAGGPIDSQLQRGSGTDASRATWTAVPVAGLPVVSHDVNPLAPTIGTPMVMRDGSLVVPVTRHGAAGASVALYSTTDGTHFTSRGSVAVSASLGAGVAVPTAARAGSRVLVLDPAGGTTEWASGRVARVQSRGLPEGASAVVFGGADSGNAVVETARCERSKSDCSVVERVYRTADGGRSWH